MESNNAKVEQFHEMTSDRNSIFYQANQAAQTHTSQCRDIILASASPRRRELLLMLGIENLIICPSRSEEKLSSDITDPVTIVKSLAHAKAYDVFCQNPKALVIGADTIVWLEGQLLGKPRDEEDAFRMLKLLSGRKHEVFTGIAVIDSAGEECEAVKSVVQFRTLSDQEIRNYIACGEPMDKAGAYGAQGKGSLFVRSIEGDFFNVMGLPLCCLGEILAKKGVSIL